MRSPPTGAGRSTTRCESCWRPLCLVCGVRTCPACNARGATLYVNLEPCTHHGRTPPCVDAVRAATRMLEFFRRHTAVQFIDGNLILTSGDTDASGRLDMVDPMRILLHLFSNGKAPVLIVQGDRDESVPLHQSRRLFDAIRTEKRLEVVNGADHRFSRPEDFQTMTRLLADWLTAHL